MSPVLIRVNSKQAFRRGKVGSVKSVEPPPMTAEEVAARVDGHWGCAPAELEARVLNDDGSPVTEANWELGLAPYRERTSGRKQTS